MLPLSTLQGALQSLSKTYDLRPAGKLVIAVAILGKSRYLGVNEYRTHPDMYSLKASGIVVCYVHAEQRAIAKVPRQSRSKVSLYVFRVLKSGGLTMAKPCPLCQIYLQREGVEDIHYTDWSGAWRSL